VSLLDPELASGHFNVPKIIEQDFHAKDAQKNLKTCFTIMKPAHSFAKN
jgi:hypothetical protein